MDSYKKGGQSGNSNLLATNRLFKKNPLFKKKKKKASGIYNPKAAFKYEEGGALLTKKVTCKNCGWKWDAADGGDDVTTCHKCGGLGLVHAQDGGDISIPTLNTMDKGGEPKTTKKEGDPKLTPEQQEYLKNKYREAAEIKKQAKAGNPLSAQMAKEFKAKYNESWTCPSDKCPVVENQYPTGYDQPIVTPVPPGKTQVGTQEIQNLDPKTGRVKTVIEPVYEDNPMPEKLPLLPPQLIDTSRAELQDEYVENNAPEYQMPGYDVERAGIYMRHGNRPTLTTVRRPGMVSKALQKFTGYNPEYSEGYTDEEGNYISGEFENAQAENRRVNFQGAGSLQDLKAQKEYNKAYDEYNAKQQFAKAMATSYGLKKDGGDISIPTLEYQKGGFSGDDPWKKIMKTTQKKIIESAKVKKDNSDWRRANDEAPNLNYQNTNQKAPVKKLSPEDKKSQENFDKNFKVEGKGNLEKIRDKIKADQEAYKKHIKAKYNQEVSQEELNEIEERGLVMYGASNGVRNPYGSISNEDLNPENHISTQFPKNATVGDYAQRGWEYLTNPGTALEYALGTGKGPMPYNINQLKEQGVQVNSDRNLVGNMFNIINPLDDVESIRSGANQVMEGNNAGYATAGFGLLGFIPGFGDAGKALRKADNILPNPTKGTDYIWETVNKNVKGDLPEGLAKQDIADIIETKVSWIESPEYASRRMATTGETAKQVAKDVEKLKNRYQNTKITFGEIPEKKTLGYYQAQSSIKGDKILIDPTKHKSLESIIGTIDHEIDHALSPASKNHNLYKNYPFLSTKEGDILRKSQKENPQSFLSKLIKGDKSYNNVYLEGPAEQQVRFNRLNQKIREDLGLTRNKGELTETQFDEWADKQNEDRFVSVSKGHDDVVDLLGAKSDNVKRSDIVKALNKAWITVPAIGLGLGAGGLNQEKKGGSTKNYIEVDIPEEQIQDYIDQGYIIEPVSKLKKFIN